MRASTAAPVTLTVVAIAAACRVVVARVLPLQHDEAATLLERSYAHLMSDNERFFNPVPWRAFTVFVSEQTDALVVQRLPSVILGSLACGLLAWAASRRLGRWSGWLVGLGMACTPWIARQHGQFRSYGLAALAAAALAVAVWELLRNPGPRRAVWAGIAVGIAGWAHFALLCWVPALIGVLLWLVFERRLTWRDGGTALLVVLGLAAGPIWMARIGFLLKSGIPSASMHGLAELDLLWRPEPLLLVAGTVALLVGDRGSAWGRLFAIAASLGIAWIVAANWLPTVRWGHLFTVAPALWLAVAAAAAGLGEAGQRRLVGAATAYAAAAAFTLYGVLEDAARLQDDAEIAAYLLIKNVATAQVIERSPDGASRSRATAVAHALGYFNGGPERCVGPDVVHDVRCRQRSRVWRGERAICITGVCVLPMPDAPSPLKGATLPAAPLRAELFGQCSDDGDMVCVRVGRWVLQTRERNGRGPQR